jgi:nucleotide-binding universal stress UspA family protein
MKWMVGLDLRPGSEGPSRFARWLAGASLPEPATCAFVHVLEEEHLRFALRLQHLDEVTADARKAAERLLERSGAAGEVRIVQGLTAEEAIAEAREATAADGVIVGRAAGREGFHIVHLGRVTRRLLRSPDSPVAVVPPGVRGEDLGDGPVIALSSLAADSVEACRFAERLAKALGRRLAVLHVARAEEPPYVAAGAWADAFEAHAAETRRELAAWLATSGVRADMAVVLLGSPVGRALELAEHERAPVLVAGSRRMSAAERIVHASTGAALAGAAPIPVVIVHSR